MNPNLAVVSDHADPQGRPAHAGVADPVAVAMSAGTPVPDAASIPPLFSARLSGGPTSGLMPPVPLSGAAGDNTVRRGEPAVEPASKETVWRRAESWAQSIRRC